MLVDTLNKNVLKMLSHLNKYPIPDPQMVKDFRWFVNKYDKFYTPADVVNAVDNVIFSGLSFSNTFTTTTTGNVINSSSGTGAISDMYSSMPDVVFNSNRVVGIAIDLVSASNVQPNDTIKIVSIDEDGLVVDILETIEIGTLQGGTYRFGWTYLNMQDDIYSVDPDTFNINYNISFYRGLEIGKDNITGSGSYTFTVTYFLA
jgi:hypothetical protein